MTELTVSSKGQIVIPADLRRRLGMGAGAKLELIEEADGVKLRVARAVKRSEVASLAGMLKAASLGKPRSLQEFDAASILSRRTRTKR